MTTNQKRGLAAAVIAALLLGIFFYLRGSRKEKKADQTATTAATQGRVALDPSVRPTVLKSAVGTLRIYEVSLANNSIVDTGAAVGNEGAAEQTAEFEITGTWMLRTIPSETEDTLVHAQLFPAKFKLTNAETPVGDSDLAPARQAMSSPLVIRYGPSGRVKGIRIPPLLDTDPNNMAILKMLIASMQIVYGEGSVQTWELVEEDGTGELLARYSWQRDGTLVKSKIKYQEQPPSYESPTIGNGIEIDASLESSFRLVPEGWIGSASYDEQVRMRIADIMGAEQGKDFSMFTNTRIDAALIAKTTYTLPELPEEWTRWVERPLADPTMGGRQRLELDPDYQLALTLQMTDILAALKTVGEGAEHVDKRVQLEKLLAMIFAQRPSEVDKAIAKILDGSLPENEARGLMEAMSEAGTPEAQAGLTTLVHSSEAAMDVRQQALYNFHALEHPTAATLDSLRKAWEDYGEPLGSTGLLAYGRAAGNMERDPAAEDPSVADAAIQTLINRYRSAKDMETKSLTLEALGNSGHPRALAIMVEVINDLTNPLRNVAIQGLRFMPVGQADDLLFTLVRSPNNEGARTAAVFAISFRDFPAYSSLLTERLREEPAEGVAMAIFRLLAARINMPEIRAVIEWAAEQSQHEEVRNAAAAMLAGGGSGGQPQN